MHELPITQNVLEITLRHAKEAGGGKITNIYLVVGRLSAVVDKSVQFYWDIISEDTPAQGARLHFRHTPIQLECLDCGTFFEPEEMTYICTACGGIHIRVAGGDELCLEAIDVEQEEAAPAESGSKHP